MESPLALESWRTVSMTDREWKPLRWLAAQRYGITPTPGTLGLVHDFLNTRGRVDGEPDLLAERGAAQRWADEAFGAWSSLTGRSDGPFVLDGGTLAELRELRDALAPVTALRVTKRHRAAAIVALTVEHGEIDWHPSGSGGRRLISAILAEVFISQHGGTWAKMRQCRDTSCHVTFFDRTWDQRQIWHDTADPVSREHILPMKR